jgi:hypothetical protein
MKPPQFAVWMFQQLGARPRDQLVDLYLGSGAIAEAWRRYAGTLVTTGQSDGTAELQADVDDARHVAARAETQHAAHASDLAVVGREQGRTCPVNGAWCESLACIDVGCTAEDANDVDAERAA